MAEELVWVVSAVQILSTHAKCVKHVCGGNRWTARSN